MRFVTTLFFSMIISIFFKDVGLAQSASLDVFDINSCNGLTITKQQFLSRFSSGALYAQIPLTFSAHGTRSRICNQFTGCDIFYGNVYSDLFRPNETAFVIDPSINQPTYARFSGTTKWFYEAGSYEPINVYAVLDALGTSNVQLVGFYKSINYFVTAWTNSCIRLERKWNTTLDNGSRQEFEEAIFISY
jgi:hypothetical protein